MQDFPGNSQKAKAKPAPPPKDERPRVAQVTTAQAVPHKRGLGRKFKQVFIQGTARETADFMVSDIIVPAVQDMLYDALEGGLRRMIHGESTRGRRSSTLPSGYSAVGHVDYRGMSTKAPSQQAPAQRMLSRRSRSGHNFSDILIPTRREADDVLEMLYECLSRFGSVSVGDLYEATGIQTSHVDYKWGWTSLDKVKMIRKGDRGYMLDLPEPETLN